MTYNWYNIFSLTDFLATGLVSRTYTVFLDGIGEKEILATFGNETGITYEDTFLIIDFEGNNPFVRSPYAVYLDSDQNVWLGIEVAT